MKAKVLIAMLLMSFFALGASAQGIEFMPEGSKFQEAVDKAKKEGKLVFLDCYTSWCGPCKMMTRNVFPTEEVGKFMNPSYVSIKIDMEKGEGPELMKKFGVSAFPTFIIFNGDGKEVGRWLGGSDAKKFIQNVKDNSKDNGSSAMDERFANGERDQKFLLEYLQTLRAAYKRDQCNLVAEALLDGKAETFASDSTLRMVFMGHLQNPFHPAFKYTAKNPQALISAIGETPVRMKMQNVWSTYPRTLITEKDGTVTMDEAKFNEYIALMDECKVQNKDQIRLSFMITYAEKKGDWNLYMKSLNEYANNKNLDINDLELCKFATPIAEKCNDQKLKDQMKKILEKRLSDLRSGKREPLKKIGNMTLSGNLDKAMEMVIGKLGGK